MDMYSRNQYLLELRSEYLAVKSKKKRGALLNEAEKRTKLSRKYLVEKLKPKSNLDNPHSERKKRKTHYDNQFKAALVTCWHIFDRPCGQRMEPLLKAETDRLRLLKELRCSDETSVKLKEAGSATIDRKLKHQKEVEKMAGKYRRKAHPLLYQKIPVRVFSEQDRSALGNIQIDLVEHCGASAAGEFINTLSSTDISSGWWEGDAVMSKGQVAVFAGLKRVISDFPFHLLEIHSDNGTEFINWHLFRYCGQEKLGFSRSRPYKKNDNCLVEQKNWTHVKKFVGYVRYDSEAEMDILNDLYRNELRLFKNFFQPVIKLVLKERIGGKIHRRYDRPKTPYLRVMESHEVPKETKQQLAAIYESLNPAQLKRAIDRKLNLLYRAHQDKNKTLKVDIKKKISVRFHGVQREPISVR